MHGSTLDTAAAVSLRPAWAVSAEAVGWRADGRPIIEWRRPLAH